MTQASKCRKFRAGNTTLRVLIFLGMVIAVLFGSAGRWDLPTGCPGWTVKDHLSHLVDYEARALGRPAPEHEPGQLPHVKNEMGQANEIGVDVRRTRELVAVL